MNSRSSRISLERVNSPDYPERINYPQRSRSPDYPERINSPQRSSSPDYPERINSPQRNSPPVFPGRISSPGKISYSGSDDRISYPGSDGRINYQSSPDRNSYSTVTDQSNEHHLKEQFSNTPIRISPETYRRQNPARRTNMYEQKEENEYEKMYERKEEFKRKEERDEQKEREDMDRKIKNEKYDREIAELKEDLKVIYAKKDSEKREKEFKEKINEIKNDIDMRKVFKFQTSKLLRLGVEKLYMAMQDEVNTAILTEIPLPFGHSIPIYHGQGRKNEQETPQVVTHYLREIIQQYFKRTRSITKEQIEEKVYTLASLAYDYASDTRKEKIRQDVIDKYGIPNYSKEKERLGEVHKKYFDLMTKVCDEVLDYTLNFDELMRL